MPVVVEKYPFVDQTLGGPDRSNAARRESPRADRERWIDIGLVNNMPDSALESTARQFYMLLSAAAQNVAVRLKFFSIPAVKRSESGREHISAFYSDIGDLWSGGIDGLIVTGTEPVAAELIDEPYWGGLTEIVDWAEDSRVATIWSCLAAQAAVLHVDGIRRSPLGDKRFGVFEHRKVAGHALLRGIPPRIAAPHARWNEIPERALTSSGYAILTRSSEAGVDMFAKQRKSLMVCFQGHPEYDADTLFKEYRRDVGRFLRRESENYPTMPSGYLDDETQDRLLDIRARALMDRREDLISTFPSSRTIGNSPKRWETYAVRAYRNWLAHIVAHKRARTGAARAAPTWRSSANG